MLFMTIDNINKYELGIINTECIIKNYILITMHMQCNFYKLNLIYLII